MKTPLLFCVLLALFLPFLMPHPAYPAPPNLLFILADDLGWSDTTLYGTTQFYQTPNVERLAARGTAFTRAHSASPLCSPTRSAILTGLSPARTGITTPNCHLPQVTLEATLPGNAAPDQKAVQPTPVSRLKTNYRTLSRTLKEAGYATGHFGKWHLGPEPYSPLEHGFDVDIPHHPGPGPAGSFVAPWKFQNFRENEPAEHIEDRMAREAVTWMETQARAGKPFFLNYWQFSVHAPFDAKQELIEKHRARVDSSDAQRSPTYAAMVESLDDAIGTLLDALDRLKLAETTIIIFTSDNGGNMYNEVDGTTPTSNRPLRGGKATLFEGGTRVPLVVVWPGLTQPGSRSNALVQSEDFYPTLLDGLGLPAQPGQVFDGVSILPALKGGSFERKAVFQYFPHAPGVPDWLPPSIAVHRGDWKLIRIFHGGQNGAHRHLLFHLRDDLGEQADLATQKPELVAELDALIESFLTGTKAVVPKPNPAFDPAKYRPELEGKPRDRSKGKAGAKAPAAARGWQASAHASLEWRDGVLHLTSTGGDPWISTRDLGEARQGPFNLHLEMSSTARGTASVYFNTSANQPFARERSIPFPVSHDGAFHEYAVRIGTPALHALRLDPAQAPGEIRLRRLDLRAAEGRTHSLLQPGHPE